MIVIYGIVFNYNKLVRDHPDLRHGLNVNFFYRLIMIYDMA